jgi:enediyne biosynthesis protein E4
VDGQSFGVTYAERPFLFRNLGNGKFDEIGLQAGSDMAKRHVGRGLGVGDFLNRGKVDVLISVLDGSPVLLRNETGSSGHWLRIKTRGTRSNRDGFGTRVEVTTGKLTQTDEVRANSSFESASDPRLHFGLGSSTRVDSIVVRWPSGKVDQARNEAVDQELVIEEGKGVVAREPASLLHDHSTVVSNVE